MTTTFHVGDYTTDCAECVAESLPADMVAITTDGGMLCHLCVTAEAARIAEANGSDCPDDDQWRIIGAQRWTYDDRCDHCYGMLRAIER